MAGSTRSSARKSGSSKASPDTVPATRQTGPETATGQQIAWNEGEQQVPKGAERGSDQKIEGGDPKPTIDGGDKPRGLQAEPALFVSNGQVPHDSVPSPSGVQPVAAVAATAEEAKKKIDQRVEEHKKYVNRTLDKDKPLDEATVGRLGRAELKAIGETRGYKMPESGTRSTRAAFLAFQNGSRSADGTATQSGSTRGTKSAQRSGSKGSRGTQSGSRAPSGRQGASNASMERATRAAAPKGRGKSGGRK